MIPALRSVYTQIRSIQSGFIEGGDVLVTEREILVGRSARTNAEGVAELHHIVSDWGYSVRALQTPPGVLHFNTDCSLLDAETILATPCLAVYGDFDGYRLIHTAEGKSLRQRYPLQ